MKKYGKSKAAALFAGMIVSAIVFGAATTVGDDGDTLVSINPSSKTVSPGDTFSVNVSCVPGQEIKSFEFKLSFNASLLQANSVSEGDIFDGYSTFFNDGTINNAVGTIVDIYGLIVGPGSVSDAGTLVSVSFTVLMTTGVSALSLSLVGVTNETAYVPVVVSNGTVSSQVYTLTVNTVGGGSVAKNPNQATYDYNDVVTLTASTNVGWTFSSWSGNLSGNQNPKTITMTGNKIVTATFTQNSYTLTVNTVGSGSVAKNPNQPTYVYNDVVTLTASANAGWAFQGWSGNLSGSQNPRSITITGNMAVTATFADSALPVINNVAVATSDVLDTEPAFGWENISSTVTDNVGVQTVRLLLTCPNASVMNLSMTNKVGTSTYYYRTTLSSYGNYSYRVWARDTTGNKQTSGSSLLSMPPNWDVNNDGDCNVFDLVLISNHYGEISTAGWIREDVDNNGQIEVLDLVLTSNEYGASWWI